MATPTDAQQAVGSRGTRPPFAGVVLGVAALAALGGFLGTSRTALVDTDEPRYAETARVMLATGEWVHPRFNEQPRHAKPALYYWLIATSYMAFGVSEFAARLPSGVLSALVGLGLFLYGRRRAGTLAGAAAFLVWATMLQTGIWSRAVLTDVVLTLFLAGGALSLLAVCESSGRASTTSHRCGSEPSRGGRQTSPPPSLRSGPSPSPRVERGKARRAGGEVPLPPPARGTAARPRFSTWAWMAAGAFMGLAVLTKGPVGLVVPLGAYILHVRSARTLWRQVREGRAWLGGIVFLAIAAPWYIAQVCEYGMTYVATFLGGDNVERFAEGPASQAGWWSTLYYLPVVLVAAFPWAWLLPSAWAERRALPPAPRNLAAFCTTWLVWTIALFSLSRTKEPQYIQSAYVPVALLVGLWVAHSAGLGVRRRWVAALGGLSLVLVSGAAAALPIVIRADARRRGVALGPDLETRCWLVAAAIAAMSVLMVTCYLLRRDREMLLAGAICGSLGAALLLAGPGTVVAAYRVQPFREAGRAVAARLAPGGRILVYGHGLRNSALVFYSGHTMGELLPGAEATLASRLRPGDALITRPDRTGALPETPPRTHVGTYGGWVMVFVVARDTAASAGPAAQPLPSRPPNVREAGGEP
jgi:4-amino-4-deoxy-L-arabinose transferase-like glycosyltransferase